MFQWLSSKVSKRGSSNISPKFQQGSGKISATFPARFHQLVTGSSRVPATFQQNFSNGPMIQQSSSKVPQGFQRGSNKIPAFRVPSSFRKPSKVPAVFWIPGLAFCGPRSLPQRLKRNRITAGLFGIGKYSIKARKNFFFKCAPRPYPSYPQRPSTLSKLSTIETETKQTTDQKNNKALKLVFVLKNHK